MTAYEEFLTNPGFAMAFTAAYGGRHEPGDALWWLEHRNAEGPSGAHSPSAELASIRNAAYARGADAAAHESLARLEAAASADRQATLEALAVARTPPVVEPAREVEDAASARRPWRLVALVAILALLLGGFAGRQVSLATAEPEVILVGTPGPTVTETVDSSAAATPQMLGVFDAAQVAIDRPSPVLVSVYPESTRLLIAKDATASTPAFAAYAAELLEGMTTCLVVVLPDTDQQSMACIRNDEMPDLGLQVQAVSGDRWVFVTWRASGQLDAQAGTTD